MWAISIQFVWKCVNQLLFVDEKYAKELGATHVVSRNAKDEEIAKEHPDLTDVFDCVGPETAEIGLKLLKSGGKLSGPAGTPKEGNEGVKISELVAAMERFFAGCVRLTFFMQSP